MTSNVLEALYILSAVGAGLPLISFIIEALRRSPSPPRQLRWAPEIPIEYAEVNGLRLRYMYIDSLNCKRELGDGKECVNK